MGNQNSTNRAFNRTESSTYDLTRFLADSTHCAVVFADHESDRSEPIPARWKVIWNNAPVRYCVDRGADRIVHDHKLNNTRLPTKICGKLDRMNAETRAFLEGKESLLEETYDEEECTVKMLVKAQLGEIDTVVLLGGCAGRFDRLLANLDSLFQANTLFPVPTVALHGNNVLTVLPEGDLAIKVDRMMLTGMCGFAPIAQAKTVVTTRGFKWNLENTEMKFGTKISTSNELNSDLLEVKTTAPLVLTVELQE